MLPPWAWSPAPLCVCAGRGCQDTMSARWPPHQAGQHSGCTVGVHSRGPESNGWWGRGGEAPARTPDQGRCTESSVAGPRSPGAPLLESRESADRRPEVNLGQSCPGTLRRKHWDGGSKATRAPLLRPSPTLPSPWSLCRPLMAQRCHSVPGVAVPSCCALPQCPGLPQARVAP